MRGQKMAKSKMWIQAKKVKVFKAKNLGIQSGLFLIFRVRKTFTKVK